MSKITDLFGTVCHFPFFYQFLSKLFGRNSINFLFFIHYNSTATPLFSPFFTATPLLFPPELGIFRCNSTTFSTNFSIFLLQLCYFSAISTVTLPILSLKFRRISGEFSTKYFYFMMRSCKQSTTMLQSLHTYRKSMLTWTCLTCLMYEHQYFLQLYVCNCTPLDYSASKETILGKWWLEWRWSGMSFDCEYYQVWIHIVVMIIFYIFNLYHSPVSHQVFFK